MNTEIKIKKDNQGTLFDDLDQFTFWKNEWQGMPEFIQEDAKPIQQIIISFQTEKDVQDFSKLLGQKITSKTKSLWFPVLKLEKPSNFVYTDEP